MPLMVFAYLQLLDLMTTLAGFRLGAQEASPFVRSLAMVRVEPVIGVAACKLAAFGLAGVCLWFRRPRVIQWINFWYAALVVWNITIILRLLA